MTISVETSSHQFPGNDTTDEFDFDFTIFDSSEIVVRDIVDATGVATVLTLGVDYELEVHEHGGTVTLEEPTVTGHTLDLRPEYEITQPVSIKNQGTFKPEVHERAFDRTVAQQIFMKRLLNRCLRFPDYNEDGESFVIPDSVAGMYLAFDANKQPIGASGTGADDGLRVDLASTTAGSSGAALVGGRLNVTGSRAVSFIEVLERDIWLNDFTGVNMVGGGDNSPVLVNALAAFDATVGGRLKTRPGSYLFGSIVDVEKRVDIDGLYPGNGGDEAGTIFISATNAGILRYPNTANRFCRIKNVGFLGNLAGSSQHALIIDNMGLHCENLRFRELGGDAIRGIRSVHGSFRNIYSSLNGGSSFHVIAPSASWNVNHWTNVTGSEDEGTIWNIEQCDGADFTENCSGEKSVSGYGVRFGSGVKRWYKKRFYTEENDQGSAVFDSGSDDNFINFASRNSSVTEADPVNNGGTGNDWDGSKYESPGVFSHIGSKVLQSVSTTYNTASTSAPNAVATDTSKPLSTEGTTVMTRSISPQQPGNFIEAEVQVCGAISAGARIVGSLFYAAESEARAVAPVPTAVNLMQTMTLKFRMVVPSPLPSSMGFSVNIASDTGGATLTFNGEGGANTYGDLVKSIITLKEIRAK